MTGRATHGAVKAEVQRLELRAAALTNPASHAYDPWAKPYAPTLDAAYKLTQRIANSLERNLRAAGDPTPEQVEAERARAPQLAVQQMQMIAAERTAAHRAELEADQRRKQRMQRIQKNASEGRRQAVKDLSVGQRLDLALARLSVVAAPASSTLDAPVSGSRDAPTPMFTVDPSERGRSQARELVERLEHDLDAAKRRLVEKEAA